MHSSDVDVLVVDDTAGAAEDYASIISSATGLRVAHTDDPAEALETAKTTSVKVLVLDQRMPTSGTELYGEIKKFDSRARAVMLTGEAEPDEVAAAFELGFKSYVAKNRLRTKLAQQVLHEYAAYQADLASAALAGDQPIVLKKRQKRLALSPDTVTYRLTRVDLLDEQHTFDSDWVTTLTLHAGQTEKTSTSLTVRNAVVLEEEMTAKLSHQFGLGAKHVVDLKAQLESELSSRFKTTTSVEAAQNQTTERTYQLPPEPPDPNQLHVRVRRIQKAPVYRRLRAELVSDCSSCHVQGATVIDFFLAKGALAVRHEDHLSDGEKRTTGLGSETL